MRSTPWLLAEPHRIQKPGYESSYGDDFGAFFVPYLPTGVKLRVLASSGNGSRAELDDLHAWDHVSVSLPNRCPNWPEMAFVKSLFWTDDETVMQLHVAASEHINVHSNCLHLWRPLLLQIPQPPSGMV